MEDKWLGMKLSSGIVRLLTEPGVVCGLYCLLHGGKEHCEPVRPAFPNPEISVILISVN